MSASTGKNAELEIGFWTALYIGCVKHNRGIERSILYVAITRHVPIVFLNSQKVAQELSEMQKLMMLIMKSLSFTIVKVYMQRKIKKIKFRNFERNVLLRLEI